MSTRHAPCGLLQARACTRSQCGAAYLRPLDLALDGDAGGDVLDAHRRLYLQAVWDAALRPTETRTSHTLGCMACIECMLFSLQPAQQSALPPVSQYGKHQPAHKRTLFTFWPPAPPDRIVVISRSDSGSSTSSTSSPAWQH